MVLIKFLVFLICFAAAKYMFGAQFYGMSEEKIKKKAELSVFFSCRTQFHLIGGLVNGRILSACPKINHFLSYLFEKPNIVAWIGSRHWVG